MEPMGESVHLNILDPEIVRIVEQDRLEKGHHQFKNIYPDTVVSEIYQLRKKYNFSAKEVMRYMREKYGASPSRSYIVQIVKFFEKRFSKQEFFNPNVPRKGLYPISSKRPTKTPEKSNLAPKKPATQKAGKGVDPLEENKPVLGVEKIPENVSALPEPTPQDIPAEDNEKASKVKPSSEPKPNDNGTNMPKKDDVSEEDKNVEHNCVPKM